MSEAEARQLGAELAAKGLIVQPAQRQTVKAFGIRRSDGTRYMAKYREINREAIRARHRKWQKNNRPSRAKNIIDR